MRKALREKGGEIVAVSADPPERIAQGEKDHADLPCKFVSAGDGECLRILGLMHPLAGRRFVAVPANILVARGGVVAWAHYAEIVMDRPDPQQVLAAVQKL